MRTSSISRIYGYPRSFSEVRRAVLLGAPGSGKSTTLRKLALELAHENLADPETPVPLLADLGKWVGDESLSQFLTEECPEAGWAVEALAKQGRLVLLLDGLNEVPTAKRGAKASEIRQLSKKLARLNAQAALVGSCRLEDYIRPHNSANTTKKRYGSHAVKMSRRL